MNGGSDFSTGNPADVTTEGGSVIGDLAPTITSTMSPTIQFKQDGGEKKAEEKKPEEQSGGSGGFLDFGKVVIKKLGF